MKLYKVKVFIRGLFLLLCICGITIAGCKKYLEVEVGKDMVETKDVFSTDQTATSAIVGIYRTMLEDQMFSSGSSFSVTALASLSADQLENFPRNSAEDNQFDENQLDPLNSRLLILWNSAYKIIYQCNLAINGLEKSTALTPGIKSQLLGEAHFCRAFSYFYLTNLFGDVPLVLTTDYLQNSKIARSPKETIDELITSDLHNAKELMGESYVTDGRVRPNKFAAATMLSRQLLYLRDWAGAEAEASLVIDSAQLYQLEPELNNVFLMTSTESIWQLVNNAGGYNTNEVSIFYLQYGPMYYKLTDSFLQSFENDDQRKTDWVGVFGSGSDAVSFPAKYKEYNYAAPLSENSTILRLAEVYLIRAEARAQQGKLNGVDGVENDINTIRNRAGLLPLTLGSSEEWLLAIENERSWELFTEWGHRWLDLKRTDRASEMLGPIKQNWSEEDLIYPIPQTEIDKNPLLKP